MGNKLLISLMLSSAAVLANAATFPIQEFRFGIYNTNRNISKAADEYVSSSTATGGDSEKFHLNYIREGVFEIANKNGELMTSKNGLAIFSKDADDKSKRWSIRGVQKDFDGYYLYYKVVSCADTNLALTFKPNTNSFALENYANEHLQKFKLNLDGLEGYAANSNTPEGEKAGTIGGLLGETVWVSTVEDLIKQLDDVNPKTSRIEF